MSNDLLEKPDAGIEPDSNQSWYDQQFADITNPDNYGKEAKEPDLADAESGANPTDGQDAARNKKEKPDKDGEDPNDGLYSKNPTRRRAQQWAQKHRSKIAAGIATSVIGATIAGIAAGPMLLMETTRNALLSEVGKSQRLQDLRYRRSRWQRVIEDFKGDGRAAKKISKNMEADGFKFIFDDKNANKLSQIVTPDGKTIPATDAEAIGDAMYGHIDAKDYGRVKQWHSKRMVGKFLDRWNLPRSSIARRVASDVADADLSWRQRMNKKLFNALGQKDAAAQIGEVSGEVAEGTVEDVKLSDSLEAQGDLAKGDASIFDGIQTELAENGTDIKRIDDPLAVIGDDVMTGALAGPSAKNILENAAKGSLGSKVFGTAKDFLVDTDILDKMCIMKNRLALAAVAARTVRSLIAMRYASEFIVLADDMRLGALGGDATNEMLSRLTSADDNGEYITSSAGYNYTMNGAYSLSRNAFEKSYTAIDGVLGGIYGVLYSNLNEWLIGCALWQNPFAQIGIAAGSAAITFFTGGISKGVTKGGVEFSKVALKEVVKEAVEKAYQKQFRKRVARKVAKEGAKEATFEVSFEGIMFLMQVYAERSLGFNFTGQEKGGRLSGILFAGAGSNHRMRNLLRGYTPATKTQFSLVAAEMEEFRKNELKNQSLYARLFDRQNTDSLAYSVLKASPFSPSQTANKTQENIAKLPQIIASSLTQTPSSFVSNSTYALVNGDPDLSDIGEFSVTEGLYKGQDLATDPAGNVQVILRDDIASIDPFENEEWLINNNHIDAETGDPISPEFIGFEQNCTLNIDTIGSVFESDPTDPAKDCMAESTLAIRFKAWQLETDFRDSMEAEAFPEEIPSNAFTTGSAANVNFDYDSLGRNSDTVTCADGTEEVGIATSQYNGSLKKEPGDLKIRLCRIPDIPGKGEKQNGEPQFEGAVVNAVVSGAWQALAQAAKADGISLRANSSFRLGASCGGTGNGKRCAQAGGSLHQLGLAIDFANMSSYRDVSSCAGRATVRNSESWSWMEQNAETYGFKQYMREAWHWDPLQGASRCGTGEGS